MKIDFGLSNNISVKNIDYKNPRTTFFVDIKYRVDDKTYHIAQQFVDLCDYDDNLNNETIYPVIYSRVMFSVDTIDLNSKEVSDILVNFLAQHKLYLHHFSITKQETYVSYTSPESKSDKIFDLTYEPTYRQNSIFIDAEVQLEDDVDYFNFLDIKTKEPIKNISDKELKELGYKYDDCSIYSFAILDEKNAEEYLRSDTP